MKVKVTKYKAGDMAFSAKDDFQEACVEWMHDVPGTGPPEKNGTLAIGIADFSRASLVYITRKQAERLRDMLVEVLS
jgi:hypothetical protein